MPPRRGTNGKGLDELIPDSASAAELRALAAKKEKREREQAAEGRKMEVSKKLAIWAAIMATLTAVASYVLAAVNLQTVETLSSTIFTACIGYLVTYSAQSAFEKNSRNKYGIDRDGNPREGNNV